MAADPAPKNAYTRVSAERTIAELQSLLITHGARQIIVSADDGEANGLSFSLSTGGLYHLPVRIDQMERRLAGRRPDAALRTKNQRTYAYAVAWRTVKDWLAAQLDLIATEMVTLDEIMLPFRILDAKGTTVYAALAARDFRLPALPESVGDARR